MEKKIESVVLTEIYNKQGLDSLLVQNHIYGCFILMEDIAESSVTMKDNQIAYDGYVFHVEKQFSEIGIRYGFVMDTALDWTTHSTEYQTTWLELFRYVSQTHDTKIIETIEDIVLQLLQQNVKQEDAFLMSALETGVLNRFWQNKVIRLIKGLPTEVEPIKVEEPKVQESETMLETQEESSLRHANVEKPIHDKRRGLHKTRRHRKKEDVSHKKNMSSTRRSTRA